MSRFQKLATGAVLAAAMASTTAAHAASVAYSDLGPRGSFNQDYHVNGSNYLYGADSAICCGTFLQGMPFTPSVSGTLDHIDIALAHVSGLQGVTISLVRDALFFGNNYGPHGTVLEQFVRLKLPLTGTTPLRATKLISLLHPTLNAGYKYWVVVTPVGIDTMVEWRWNNQGNETNYVSTDGEYWDPYGSGGYGGAFDVWFQ